MSAAAQRSAVAFALGLAFGAGLLISGMTRPDKIIGFLDVAGPWAPPLAFVMGGALLVYLPGYRWLRHRSRPALAEGFHLPAATRVTGSLIAGGALFGAGWGLSGFCPAPALVATPAAAPEALGVVGGMVAGMLLVDGIRRRA